MLTLPDKDPEELLDYQVSFADLIPAGYIIDEVEAVVESADPSQSPLTLVVESALASTSGSSSPERMDSATLWLSGGLTGCKYTIKVTVSDTQDVPHDRQYVRRAKIKVKPL